MKFPMAVARAALRKFASEEVKDFRLTLRGLEKGEEDMLMLG